MFTPEVELADVMEQQPTRLQASVNSFESNGDCINLVSIFRAEQTTSRLSKVKENLVKKEGITRHFHNMSRART